MKKRVTTLLLSSAAVMMLMSGCGSKYADAPSYMPEGTYQMAVSEEVSKGDLHHAVMLAGEQTGWNMTEFKSNAIIGEKIVGDKSASMTVHLSSGHVTVTKETSTLGGDYEGYVSDFLDAVKNNLGAPASH